jgi:hypothetical protein
MHREQWNCSPTSWLPGRSPAGPSHMITSRHARVTRDKERGMINSPCGRSAVLGVLSVPRAEVRALC